MQTRRGIGGVVVGGVGLPRQPARVVPGVGEHAATGNGGNLGLAFAEQAVVEGVGRAVLAVLTQRPGGHHRRGVRGQRVGVLLGGRLAASLGTVQVPGLDQAPQWVVLQIGALTVGADIGDGFAPRGFQDVGGDVPLGVGGGHRPGGETRGGAVTGGGPVPGSVAGFHGAAVVVVRGAGDNLVGGAVPALGPGNVSPGRWCADVLVVVGGAHVADQRGVVTGPSVARQRDGADLGGVRQVPGAFVAGVGGAGALLVTGDGRVTSIVDLDGETVVGERVLDLRASPAAVSEQGPAANGLGLLQERVVLALRGGGALQPGIVDGRRDHGAAVVLAGLADKALQPLVVLDLAAVAVVYPHVAGLAVGQLLIAVHAPQVQGFGDRLSLPWFTLDGADSAVATPFRPGAVLRLGEVVLVVVPRRVAQVLVGRFDQAGAAGAVVFGHLQDDVLVEPVQARLQVPVRSPPDREAAQRVGFRIGRHPVGPPAVGFGVADRRVTASLVAHADNPVAGDRGKPLSRVHPVRHGFAEEHHLRIADRAVDVTGVRDPGEPQRRGQVVAGERELVAQRPGVDVSPLRAVSDVISADVGDDPGQPLPCEERRVEDVGAFLVGVADLLRGHVRPRVGRVLGQLIGIAGDRTVR